MRTPSSSSPQANRNPQSAQLGVIYAALAYTAWGLFPLFWKQLGHLPVQVVLGHRVIWSAVFSLSMVLIQNRFAEFRSGWGSWRGAALFVVPGLLLMTNWSIYIWAVDHDRVLETGLGYFISPLVKVALGTVILRERLSRMQWIAVAIATAGVVYQATQLGGWPWVALGLASTFGVYGLLRKIAPMPPIVCLAGEMLGVTPIAVLVLMFTADSHPIWSGMGNSTHRYLLLTGVATTLPLWWYGLAGRRLPYSTLGVFQYYAPMLHIVLAVWVFHEPIFSAHYVTLGLILVAIAIFVWDMRRKRPSHATSHNR